MLAVAGVIEGFYGRPWTWAERVSVMRACVPQGLTHYVYAPKDDPKHREQWGVPYDRDELARFAALQEQSGAVVGFGISPGGTIRVDDAGDRAALAAKADSVIATGVRLVVLALDDLPPRPGLGDEHARLTTWLHGHLDGRAALMLVPTDYVGTRSSAYLDALAAGVPDDVPIGWTGPAVVNDVITADEARARRDALGGRLPVLWDNYPVNDGPMADRLFLGPLHGRDPHLVADGCLAGYFANPMTQPTASTLPLASVAAWCRGGDPEEAWSEHATRSGWRTFAEACDGTEPRRLVDALVEEGDGPGWIGAARAAAEWFTAAAGVAAPGLEHEVQPWLDQVHHDARAALGALRLYQATRPALDLDADGNGRAAPVDGDDVARRALAVAAAWVECRRASVSVLGVRCGVRPALGQGPAGGWAWTPGALQEDANALDDLVRLATDTAAACAPGPLAVMADGAPVLLDDEGRFRVDPEAVVLTRCGTGVVRGKPPCAPPLPDRRLR